MTTSQVLLHYIRIGAALGVTGGCASSGKQPVPETQPLPAAVAPTDAPVGAAVPAPPPDGFDWDVLARLAAADSTEARALLLDAEATRYQTAVDTGWRNPRLSSGRHWGQEDETSTEIGASSRTAEWQERDFNGYTAALRVYTANPFVNRWLRRRGAADAQAKEEEAKEASYAIFCEVKSLCLEAEISRGEIDLLQQMVSLREQACALRREQSDAGVVSALQLIRSETRLAALRAEISERQTGRQQLIRRLAILTGIPSNQLRLRPAEPARQVKPAYLDEAALTELAFLRRPDLIRAQREQDAAEHAVRAARAGQIPWFEYVEAQCEAESADTYSYEQNDARYDSSQKDETEWQIRAAVTLPVFNWLGDEIRLTRTELAAAKARVHGLYEQIRREVGGVLQDYCSARAERDRIASDCERLRSAMTARIDALAAEPTVRSEEVLAAREELLEYVRVCMKAEQEGQRLTQYLETVSGGPLTAEP